MSQSRSRPTAGLLIRIAVIVGFSAGVGLLMLYLAGTFSPKVPPVLAGKVERAPATLPALATATLVKRPVVESAVGTVRASSEATISSRLAARVVAVPLRAGQQVSQGDLLVQAQVRAAIASRDQAMRDEERLRGLPERGAATQFEYDQAFAKLQGAIAEVQRAEQAVVEVRSLLEYATLRAPMSGIVVDKKVEVGDTVTPGQVLLSMYDPSKMQLEASVRESLAARLRVGQRIAVKLDALEQVCDGTISEIVPRAEAASRSFLVKVTGPCPEGIYSGMFGRLLIPLDEEQVLLVPESAVRRVGQLQLVDVLQNGKLARRSVRVGRTLDGMVEIVSGLSPGEQVALASTTERTRGS
jgi:RND family efflux transporter MFP subunit